MFHRGRTRVLATATTVLLASVCAARGADWWELDTRQTGRPTYNDFGEVGLLQVPTARLPADSEVAVGASHVYPYDKYYFNFVPVPWAEAVLRYTNITDKYYGPLSFSGTQNYKDRSFDIKLRLAAEGPSNPDISIMLRDFAGTGLWSSEYVLASRRYYDFDVSAGLAWGQSGTRGLIPNPLRVLGHHFDTRVAADSTGSGGVGTDFFAGPYISPVGGIVWQTPISSLKVKIEYDGNNYSQDFGLAPDHGIDPHMLGHSPINMGVVWSPFRFLDLALGRERGQIMANITMHGNMKTDRGVPIVDTPPPQVAKVASPQPSPWEVSPQPSSPLVGGGLRPAPQGGGVVVELDGRAPVPAISTLCDEALAAFNGANDLDGITFLREDGQGTAATLTVPRDALFRSREVTGDCRGMSDISWRTGPAGVEKAVVASATSPRSAANSIGQPEGSGPARTADDDLASSEVAVIGRAIFADLEREQMVGFDFGIENHRAVLRFAQGKYRNEATAIGRAARIVANRLPPQVAFLDVVLMRASLPVLSASLVRSDITKLANGQGSPQEVAQHLQLSQPGDFERMVSNPNAYPNWGWGLEPKMRENMGGPQNFFFFQVFAILQANISPLPGWNLSGAIGRDIYNNFKDLTLESNSALHHVRSDIALYLKGAPTWMDSLYTTYSTALGGGFYGGLTAGYMELMYAGVGGEILYKPFDARWAVGVDANRVRQRDFDGTFGLLNYQVSTGHASFYYRWPYYDITTVIRAGRFLAGDTGATFEVRREFDNGMMVGMFVTRTNVSAAAFGEGSFDKGLFVSIPLELFTGEHTASRGNALWRPVTRDGGQLLGRPLELYEMVRDSDSDAIMKGWKAFGD